MAAFVNITSIAVGTPAEDLNFSNSGWTKNGSAGAYGTANLLVTNANGAPNGVYCTSVPTYGYLRDEVPGSATQIVRGKLRRVGAVSASQIACVFARATAGGDDYFRATFQTDSSTCGLYQVVNGTPTTLITPTSVAGLTAVGQEKDLEIRVSGISPSISVSLWWNGSQVGATQTVNNAALDGVGRVGIGNRNGAISATTGAHFVGLYAEDDTSAPPTTATLTGPSTGTTGAASSNFTITLDLPATSTVTFTPAGTVGSHTFSPAAPQITAGNSSVTFTATPASDGAHVISITNDAGLTNVGTVTYTTSTAGDTTAPTLISPVGTGGAMVCSGSVSTNESGGTLYVVATASATAPTKAQVKAGQDHIGAAALRVVSQAVAVSGTQTVASGTVTAGTRYLHFMHEDAAANQSNVVSSASFAVSSLPTITTDVLRDETNAVRASHTVAKVVATRLSDLAQICTWSNQVTSAGGVLTLAHASLTPVPHIVTTASADGAAAGAKVYTPA